MSDTNAIYTIVISGTDADRGIFATPFAVSSYMSVELARAELARRIAERKPTLDSRYDGEERGLDSWEAYQKESPASCYLRIEILESELRGNSEINSSKGGND